ncbi:MAG: hypothetical protein EBU74_10060 [Betaproteobacteria bacterium]|nr:hypothetical protein [Betaproteobacteria bacterium]
MFTLHCTKKLLDRIHPNVAARCDATTRLGNWYATALFWKLQIVLLVNERTLLPVLMPLAPAATLASRIPAAVKEVLIALDLPADFIQVEIEFAAEVMKDRASPVDTLALSLRLAEVPCGPLTRGAGFPDRAVRELADGLNH